MPEATELEEVTRWPGRSGATAEISVLIPCWHGEETIGGALDGVEALTQQRRALRLGKIRAAGVLIMVWSVLLALRRWLLDGWSAARAGAV